MNHPTAPTSENATFSNALYQQATCFVPKTQLVRGIPLKPLASSTMKGAELMQNRTVEIKCRLTQKEADSLNKRVKKSGLSRESYLRHLINGLVPTDAPPPDYFSMMKELLFGAMWAS